MRATLIFNPQAGAAAETSPEEISADLRNAGFCPTSYCTTSKDDLKNLMLDPGDVIVVAGGDGSVRTVAGLVAGTGIPMMILPLGTANNIATALGLSGTRSEWMTGGCSPFETRSLDMGVVRSPWGNHFFLESAGVGLFADLLKAYDPTGGRSFPRALKAAAQVVPRFVARDLQVRIDGCELSGKYVLMEAMNTPCLGMRTPIAPEADPSDGLLDIALVEERQDIGLASYIRQLASGDPTALPNWNVHRGRQIAFLWDGSTVHADEELFGSEEAEPNAMGALIEISVKPRAFEVWLPLRRNEGRCGGETRPATQAGSPAPLASDGGDLPAHLPRRLSKTTIATTQA